MPFSMVVQVVGPEVADTKLTITGHLQELTRRLTKAAVAILVTTLLSFIFTNKIFELLKSRAPGVQLIRTGVTEMVSVYIKVALFSGFVLALPFVLYQLVMFVSPALHPREKRYLYALLPSALLAFFAGAAFGFFVLIPPAMNFLIHFDEDIATPLIRISDYVSLISTLLFWLGIAFEIPLVMFFLAKIGIVTARKLSKMRRWAILAAVVLGAIITPTVDPINQSLVAGTLWALYEIGILLAWLARRGKAESASP